MKLFLQNMGTAGSQVLILYIIVAVGFVADRLHVFTEKTARSSNNLMFYVVTPCVIVNSFLNTEFSAAAARDFAIALGLSFAAHGVGMIIASFFFNNKNDPNRYTYKFASVYGNVGYMALPLSNAVLGAEGVFYGSGAVVAYNILAFTHGIHLMNRDKREKFNPKTIIINPGVISVVIGLGLFLLSANPPKVISAPIGYIAELNTPLAMLILGTYISNTDIKNMFKIKAQYTVLLIRLVAVPLIMLGFFKLLGLPPSLTTACAISAAAPSANNTVMFAAKYDKDTGVAGKVVALNSFVSVITLPMMIALSQL